MGATDFSLGGTSIQLEGNRQIVMTGHCAILLYSKEEMRVRCGKLIVRVTGDGLELRTLDEEELSIVGLIAEVGFLTGEV